ncbi:MAG: efflux RND transporter periplasmic adaptor subunit [Gemmataceae bacterium]
MLRWVGTIVLIVVLLVGGVAAYPYLKQQLTPTVSAPPTSPPGTTLQRDGDVLVLPAETPQKMGLKTERIRVATRPRLLPPMTGWLNVDQNKLVRVHPRFSGEIREFGIINGHPVSRGDEIKKGQLLCVIWSKELGTKKSELVDALAQLRFKEEYLKNLENTGGGVVGGKLLSDAQLAVNQAQIAADRAERELITSQLTKREVDEIHAEADKLIRKEKLSPEAVENWRRLEVRSEVDGVVVEKNYNITDIVDTSADLFKVSDLRRLVVNAHMYEEDLPKLYELRRQGKVDWLIRLQSNPDAKPETGTVEEIGVVLDPTQHTALVQGYVNNPNLQLRVGQFVNAQIVEPAEPGTLEVPANAVVDDGTSSFVFVARDDNLTRLERRPVAVVRRFSDVVQLRAEPSAAEAARGARPISNSDEVIVSGAVELNGALEDLPAKGE